MKFINTDLKRIFTEPAFYISIILGMLLLFGGFAYLMLTNSTDRLFETAQSLALPFAAPVLAAMPYSVMIMQEKETRYSSLMRIKLGGRGYQLRRLLTCGFSGAMALFIPHLMLFTVCTAIEGIGEYPAWQLVIPLSFGFSYSAVSYGLTFVNRQRYVPLIMPQVIYLLAIYSFPILGLSRFYPPLDIAPSIYGGEITLDRFIIPALLTIIAFLLTLLGKTGGRK